MYKIILTLDRFFLKYEEGGIDPPTLKSSALLVLKNGSCLAWPTLIDLKYDEPIQWLCYYPFTISLDKCNGKCNTPNDLSWRIYVSKETEHKTLNVFNMKIRINKSQTIIKLIFCGCRCEFKSKKCNSNQAWNNSNHPCDCKNQKKNLNRTWACVKTARLMII